jgi:hypothetical protein
VAEKASTLGQWRVKGAFIYMGCCLATPAVPDGDGISSLPWLPDQITKRIATFERQKTCRTAKILINQEAIWRKLNGEGVECLPYPPGDNDRRFACYSQMRDCKILVNQEAIWLKLQSGAPAS